MHRGMHIVRITMPETYNTYLIRNFFSISTFFRAAMLKALILLAWLKMEML